MPYRRKDSPVWWVSYSDPGGKRVRRTTGTTDRKEAEALEAKWKLESYRSLQWNEQPKRSFEELMVGYLRDNANKRSADKDRMRTGHLRCLFGGRIMNELKPADVRAYIAKRMADGVSPSTINRETSLFSAAINYANREWDWELPNPAKGRKLKEPEGRVRWIRPDEAEKLIRAARNDRQARQWTPEFIRLALNTGCRKQELLGLEWNRVDLHNNLIYLEAHHTKNGKRHSVPLNAKAREAILSRARFHSDWCPNSQWVFSNRKGVRVQDVRRSFATACKKAGIEDFHIHDLRHTCAAWLVSAGVALTEVRDLLGHSTIKMTERYAHLAPENVRVAVEKLETTRSRFGHAERAKEVLGENNANVIH